MKLWINKSRGKDKTQAGQIRRKYTIKPIKIILLGVNNKEKTIWEKIKTKILYIEESI
jgi:hypothetical protein